MKRLKETVFTFIECARFRFKEENILCLVQIFIPGSGSRSGIQKSSAGLAREELYESKGVGQHE